MSRTDEPLSLAALDAAAAWTTNPRVWDENLAALRRRQPGVAERLAKVTLPPNWRAVCALDGAVTYRLEDPAQPPAWFAGAAAPDTRAAALVGGWRHTDRNVALTTIAAGAEAALLLAQLPRHVAVFVFESAWESLAAVLRVRSFANDLDCGRLWFLPPGDERGELSRILNSEAGLLPPASLLGPDLVAAERLAQLKALCEELSQEILAARQAELARLAQPPPAISDNSQAEAVSLAVVAASHDSTALAAGAALVAAARLKGWPARLFSAETPTEVHILHMARALAAQRPKLTLLLNPTTAGLPTALLGRTLFWYLDLAAVPAALPEEAGLLVAGTPMIAERLRSGGRSGGRAEVTILDCFCGVAASGAEPGGDDPGAQGTAAQDAAAADGPVVFLADRPAADPASCGIEQPTHRILWERLREAVEAEWDQPRPLRGAALLARLERELGMTLGAAALEAHFVRMLDTVLIPSVTVERILHVLGSTSGRVVLIGRGWTAALPAARPPGLPPGATVGAADWFAWRRGNQVCIPQVIVSAGRADPLTPELLEAGAAGFPLLLHAAGGRALAPLLGEVLRPGQHFETFSDAGELRRRLQVARERPAALVRQASRTRTHLLAAHTWGQRLEQLAVACGPSHAAGAAS